MRPRLSSNLRGLVVHVETLLRAVLTRRYEVQSSGNSSASHLASEIITRLLSLHREGKGPVEISRLLGLTRKQVASMRSAD